MSINNATKSATSEPVLCSGWLFVEKLLSNGKVRNVHFTWSYLMQRGKRGKKSSTNTTYTKEEIELIKSLIGEEFYHELIKPQE